MLKKTFGLLVVLVCLIPAAGWAGDGVLKTAGKVLQIGVGPRTLSMGEAGTAVVDDIFSLYWNPAGLSRVKGMEISYMHNFWMGGIQDAYLGYSQPFLAGGLGVAINYINYGEFDRIDEVNGLPVPTDETFTPYSFILSAGYGLEPMNWLRGLRIGGALKILSESVDTFNLMTLALDLGGQLTDVLPGLDAGLLIQNAGLPLAGYPVPTKLRAGVAYHLPMMFNPETDGFLAVADANIPFPTDQPLYVNVGLEYTYRNMLAGRIGYKIADGSLGGLTAGLGVAYHGLRLDYAFMPYGTLGATHQLSLTTDLSLLTAPAETEAVEKPKDRRAQMAKHAVPPVAGPGAGASDALAPSLSSLGFRKPFSVDVAVQTGAHETQITQATFTLAVNTPREVQAWQLTLIDSQGNNVYDAAGEGVPGTLEWDGKDAKGRRSKDSIFFRYRLQLMLLDGGVETLEGPLSDKTPAPVASAQEPAQAALPIILFEEGSADLTEAALTYLKQAAEIIKNKPYVKVTVEGYTDDKDEELMAFLLSRRRADAVSRFLTATYKIPLKNIEIFGRGSKNPRASNQTEEGRKQNRRVEITIVYKK